MAQAVTPTQIKFGYECFYRCDQCYRNVYENYQWLNMVALAEKDKQDDSKCPYCQAEIDFDLSGIDKPSNAIAPILRFPGKDYAFVFKTDQTILTTVTIIIRGTIGKSLEVNWGDKNKIITTLTGGDQILTHDYTTQAQYYISIFCESNIISKLDITSSKLIATLPTITTQTSLATFIAKDNTLSGSVTDFTGMNQLVYLNLSKNNLSGTFPSTTPLTALTSLYCEYNSLSGNLPTPSNCPNLQYYYLHDNQCIGSLPNFNSNQQIKYIYTHRNNLSGTIPAFNNNPNLTRFLVYLNNLSGTIPSLTPLTSIAFFRVNRNQLTGYTPSIIALTLNFITAQYNLFPSAAINQILADIVTNLALRPAGGRLYLHGTGNQAPTGQGIIDKAAIIAHGWDVLTN